MLRALAAQQAAAARAPDADTPAVTSPAGPPAFHPPASLPPAFRPPAFRPRSFNMFAQGVLGATAVSTAAGAAVFQKTSDWLNKPEQVGGAAAAARTCTRGTRNATETCGVGVRTCTRGSNAAGRRLRHTHGTRSRPRCPPASAGPLARRTPRTTSHTLTLSR